MEETISVGKSVLVEAKEALETAFAFGRRKGGACARLYRISDQVKRALRLVSGALKLKGDEVFPKEPAVIVSKSTLLAVKGELEKSLTYGQRKGGSCAYLHMIAGHRYRAHSLINMALGLPKEAGRSLEELDALNESLGYNWRER